MMDTKILVIEDEIALSESIKSHFESEGYDVKVAYDGSEGITFHKMYDPDIIILDDSSSALDYKTDLKLRRAIKADLKTTTVIVSQRIASVMSADKILVVDEGRIVGSGKHEDLLLECDTYKQMAEVQLF